MPSETSILKLRLALEAIHQRGLPPDGMTALRTRVSFAVRDLRDIGTTPQRVGMIMRQLAAESGAAVRNPGLGDLLVEWCGEEYSSTPSPTDDATSSQPTTNEPA